MMLSMLEGGNRFLYLKFIYLNNFFSKLIFELFFFFFYLGNVVNGTIGKQMVDTLVESASNVELILKYFDMFLKLKVLTETPSFKEIDVNNDGWVTPKDFKEKMEQQKSYTA